MARASDEDAARALVAKYRAADFDDVLAEVAALWNDLLDTVQVRTPDRALDILLNDWLLYQVTACRLWARTAYYQASGAWGYRDQLQDVMALCVSRPDLARGHLLRAAGRQFAEGDVQHWWLPPRGQGIRTKIRDDRIWMAFVAMHYVEVSGDRAVLEEVLPFLKGQSIPDDATDAFFQPEVSEDKVSLYEHCALAIDSSLTRGAHGLPLIGTGDWNDGMNAVGAKGRGESSWLGWFLLSAIDALAAEADRRDRPARDQVARLRHRTARVAGTGVGRRMVSPRLLRRRRAARFEKQRRVPHRHHRTIVERDRWSRQSCACCAGDGLGRPTARRSREPGGAPVHARRSTRTARKTPATSRAIRPACARTAGNTRTARSGRYSPGSASAMATAPASMLNLLNPIHHSDSAEAVARYKVEPYVACADVYSVAPHVGRGGWTWYTGSAAWLYRAGLEAVLGFHLQGDRLRLDPCLPKAWPGFQLTYRHGAQRATCYEINVENPDQVCRGVKRVEMDGQTLDVDAPVALVDDGKTHRLRIVLGSTLVNSGPESSS